MKTLTLSVALTVAAVALAPAARADMALGNYELQIVGRYDFHTWVWVVSGCYTAGSRLPAAGCAHVSAVARPVAKAFSYAGIAQIVDGRYTLTVDVPDGLRCGDIYYGPRSPRTTPTRGIPRRWLVPWSPRSQRAAMVRQPGPTRTPSRLYGCE